MCFWETIGRCQTAVFQTFRLHALCTDARALFMRRWTCLTFLGCAYISDTLFNVVLLVFAIERFRMQYDPLAYDTLVKRCTLFVATFVTVGAILYVVGPPVILHINEQGTIRCLSYYAPLQSFQTESFLIFSFVIRTMAILINLASIVHTKLTHNKKVFPINQSTNGTQKEATKIFIDYVKIVVWIETCFGMPYSILREITLSMNLSDFVFMHVLAISIFTDIVSRVTSAGSYRSSDANSKHLHILSRIQFTMKANVTYSSPLLEAL
uniref:G-protein coupled receptors family 1 profile domain-containing protein n=1 Tax=Romanomermis culicivorax TaxID=13658 RepID=A0A915IZH3_ROMCU